MTLEEEKQHVIEILEDFFTPDEARNIVWLVDRHGKEIVLQAIKEIGDRKQKS